MYCPECGTDAADAKFCPECGNDLGALKDALRGSEPAGKPAGQAAQQRTSAKQNRPSAAEAPGRKPGQLGPRKQTGGAGTKPWVIWAVVGAVVVPIVLIVLVSLLGHNKSTPAASTNPPPVANTSGSYSELVQRANGLFDQAQAAITGNDIGTAVQYGQAAAQVYAAAWKKQPGDPSVGTDWATAMFYAGDFQGAIARIEIILKANPTFQTAWLNAGNYYWHASQMTKDPTQKQTYVSKAKAAYAKAIAINATNADGVQAAKYLKQVK
jgi:hypothetical protein